MQHHRLASRRGKKRAAIAVAHAILTSVYHLLTQQTDYQDLEENYYDERKEQSVVQRLKRRLEKLGDYGQFHQVGGLRTVTSGFDSTIFRMAYDARVPLRTMKYGRGATIAGVGSRRRSG